MTTEVTTKSPEPSGKGCMEVLKTLNREEILEVLSDGLCSQCQAALLGRIHNLVSENFSKMPLSDDSIRVIKDLPPADVTNISLSNNNLECQSPGQENLVLSSNRMPESDYALKLKRHAASSSPASVNSSRNSTDHLGGSEILLNDGLVDVSSMVDNGLSEEQKEQIRFSKVCRKKDFVCIEKIRGKSTNILEGLQLHTKVFNAEEQKKIVECIYSLQLMGQNRQLKERTYSEPKKWMRGKGRVTMQFGCCYNYAVDQNGYPPGIIRDEEVDPLPPIFKQMIKRMVRWHVLPPSSIPNSCIVNVYDEGDCIPPHIDHHDFLRPFCTVSFLSECNIVFGSNLKIVSPGEFSGPVSIPLPVGSVLILNGNGADIAKHSVPGVPAKRISVTFRKMNDSKLPYKFSPDPELLRIKPLVYSPLTKSPYQQSQPQKLLGYHSAAKSPVQQNNYQNGKAAAAKVSESGDTTNNTSFFIGENDFPPLGSSNSSGRHRANKSGLKQ